MDAKPALEAIDAIIGTVPDGELPNLFEQLKTTYPEALGEVATGTSFGHSDSPETVEAPEAPKITPDYLLGTLDTALATYGTQLDVVNATRASVKTSRGQKKPAQLEVIEHKLILARAEQLLANPAFMADLQAQADYFTAHPEQGSPAVGFDLVVIPEGLVDADEEAIAYDLQTKLNPDYSQPYIRSAEYNDKRQLAVTGSGFIVAVAPRHYNVPMGTATENTTWMKTQNAQTTATQLQTATDGQALAQINNLRLAGELSNPDTRFDTSYFRRFDQKPVGGYVSGVVVDDDGELRLDESNVRYDDSTRALVEPKA